MIEYELASRVKSEPPQFYWYPYLIDNNINIVGGESGTGKTFFLAGLIAATTNFKLDGMGGVMRKQGKVLYMGGEDGNGMMKDRLELVGADMEQVYLVEKRFDCMGKDFPDLIDAIKPSLIIFDALLSYFPEGVNANNYLDTRRVMDYLRDLAREKEVCMVAVIHPSKREDYKLLHRFTGSGGFVDSVRSAIYIGFHPTDADLRVGIQPKNNCSESEPFVFELSYENGFSWRGTDSSISIKDIERAVKLHSSNKSNILNEYIELVCNLMKVNPDGFSGTAADILKEYKKIVNHNYDARSFGSAINRDEIRNELLKRGIILKNGKSTNNRQQYIIYYKNYSFL